MPHGPFTRVPINGKVQATHINVGYDALENTYTIAESDALASGGGGAGTLYAYAEDNGVATGNTATANATAITTALGTYRKVEFRSSGTFNFDPFTVPAGKTLVLPEGTTIKLANGANANFITNNGRIVGDGVIDGNKANQSAGVAVVMNTAGCRIKGVSVINSQDTAVYGAVVKWQAVDVTVTDAGGFGIWDRLGQCLIERCTVTDCLFAGIRTNAYTGIGNLRTRILGNTVSITDTSTICIELWGESAGEAYGAVVGGNTTNGGSMGISFSSQHSASCTGNTVNAPANIGIELAASLSCTLSGNTVDGDGVTIGAIGCSNTNNGKNTITGNTLIGWTATGIHVLNGSRYTIGNNPITGPGIGSGKAIHLQNTIKSSLTGNLIDNVNYPFDLENAGTITMTGNTLDTVGLVFQLYHPTAGTYDDITFTGNTITGAAYGIYDAGGAGTLGNRIVVRANPNNIGMPDYLDFKNDVQERWGTGTPLSVVTAGVGSIFHRRDGGAATCLYVKESGAGAATGWVAK